MASAGSERSRLSSAACMALELMRVGWVLHLPSNASRPPAIWRASVVGSVTMVRCVGISHDDVLDLQQGGYLEERGTFDSLGESVTVYGVAN